MAWCFVIQTYCFLKVGLWSVTFLVFVAVIYEFIRSQSRARRGCARSYSFGSRHRRRIARISRFESLGTRLRKRRRCSDDGQEWLRMATTTVATHEFTAIHICNWFHDTILGHATRPHLLIHRLTHHTHIRRSTLFYGFIYLYIIAPIMDTIMYT